MAVWFSPTKKGPQTNYNLLFPGVFMCMCIWDAYPEVSLERVEEWQPHQQQYFPEHQWAHKDIFSQGSDSIQVMDVLWNFDKILFSLSTITAFCKDFGGCGFGPCFNEVVALESLISCLNWAKDSYQSTPPNIFKYCPSRDLSYFLFLHGSSLHIHQPSQRKPCVAVCLVHLFHLIN